MPSSIEKIQEVFKGESIIVNNFDSGKSYEVVVSYQAGLFIGGQSTWGAEFHMNPTSILAPSEIDNIDFSKGCRYDNFNLSYGLGQDDPNGNNQQHFPSTSDSFNITVNYSDSSYSIEDTLYDSNGQECVFKGFAIYFKYPDPIYYDNQYDCWFFDANGAYSMSWETSSGKFPEDTSIVISPVYSRDTTPTPTTTLTFDKPIVVKYDNSTTHSLNLSGYNSSGSMINQSNILHQASSEESYAGIFSTNEINYLYDNYDYELEISSDNGVSDFINKTTVDSSILEFINDGYLTMYIRERYGNYNFNYSNHSHEFLGFCLYAYDEDQTLPLDDRLPESGSTGDEPTEISKDRCYFISKDNLSSSHFSIAFPDGNFVAGCTVHIAPVFEGKRPVFLTNPVIASDLFNGQTFEGQIPGILFDTSYGGIYKYDGSNTFKSDIKALNSISHIEWDNNLNKTGLEINSKDETNIAEYDRGRLFLSLSNWQGVPDHYNLVGFIAYSLENMNDVSNIENWLEDGISAGNENNSALVHWFRADETEGSMNLGISLNISDSYGNTIHEHYLAVSPVFVEDASKTIILGNALLEGGGETSHNYTVTVDGTTYSRGDEINVKAGDTVTIICNDEESWEYVGAYINSTAYDKNQNNSIIVTYDELDDENTYQPIFHFEGSVITNDTARQITITDDDGNNHVVGPWEDIALDSFNISGGNSIIIPGSAIVYDYNGDGKIFDSIDLKKNKTGSWDSETDKYSAYCTNYQANLYVSVPSKGIDIYKLDFYQGNGSCSVLTNSDSDVAVRFVALPWDAQSAETYHLSQFINSLGDEDFKEFYLRGKLPMNLNAISYSSNKKFKSMKCETSHVVPIESNSETNEPSHDLRDIYIRENVGFDVYYIDKVSDIDSIRDTWVKNDGLADETNETRNTLAETVRANDEYGTYDEYGVFTGNGVYNFIIKGSEINAEDKSTYDYEIYNCGPLVGYVEEQDSNTPIDDEDELFLGVTQPGSEVVTAFGWETVEGERQLMTLTEYDNTEGPDDTIIRPFYAPNIINPGSWSDSGGTYNDNPTDKNYTTTENEVTGSLMSMEEMPKDYCAFQTGNQFIQFRLRNPYDGSVLNFDEKSAYTLNKGVWQRNISTTAGTENETMLSDTTHEQTNFLTLWEQRSLFNALNGKPTYVNEVISYITYTEKEVEDMALNADSASADNGATGSGSTDGNYCFPDTVWYDAYLKGVYGLRDAKGNIVTPLIDDPSNPNYQKPNPDYHPDEDIEFVIPARNGRKAGRALVDNIDDWVQWYKREETAGVIAGGNTSAPGGTPVMFVGPLLNKEKELCIESDATRSNLTLSPGESITVPIVVLYKCYEADGRDSCKYTVGFDLRNSQYQDPLYYEFTCSARYAASVTDTVSSQKASVNSNVKYNVTVR